MKERISALMDGELAPQELDALLASLKQDPQLLQDWSSWQAGGEVLRGESTGGGGFMQGFSARLAAEPVLVAPRSMRAPPSRWRRFLLPAGVAASVAMIGLGVWRFTPSSVPLTPPVAQNQVAVETEALLRDYLVAHRQSEGNPFADRETAQNPLRLAGQQ